jgi:hypothetical protein
MVKVAFKLISIEVESSTTRIVFAMVGSCHLCQSLRPPQAKYSWESSADFRERRAFPAGKLALAIASN